MKEPVPPQTFLPSRQPEFSFHVKNSCPVILFEKRNPSSALKVVAASDSMLPAIPIYALKTNFMSFAHRYCVYSILFTHCGSRGDNLFSVCKAAAPKIRKNRLPAGGIEERRPGSSWLSDGGSVLGMSFYPAHRIHMLAAEET